MWGCSTKQRRARARGGWERRFPSPPRTCRRTYRQRRLCTYNVKVHLSGVEFFSPTSFMLVVEEL